MSQVDTRNSSATKRARTDGFVSLSLISFNILRTSGRREDDWTCPSCGNVNFSFRTTCNMRNCTQPRPADHNGKSAPKPIQPLQGYPNPPYGSSGSPYLGMQPPPYGSSVFNGASIPPYDVRFSGGSTYYNYGNRVSGGSPYRPLHLSGPPPPYSGGSIMGNGGLYGMPPPPMMDRYGFNLPPMGLAAMGPPRPGFFLEDKSPKKDVTRDNDWACPKCGNVNFSFRTVCNMRKCNTPKPGPQMPDGSWRCERCNNINFPFRTKCNRQNCGADKPSEPNESPSPASEGTEQVCGVACFLCAIVLDSPSCMIRFLFVHKLQTLSSSIYKYMSYGLNRAFFPLHQPFFPFNIFLSFVPKPSVH
ncbi:hypothetical protein V2J09_003805 [Rumex salicifolius]